MASPMEWGYEEDGLEQMQKVFHNLAPLVTQDQSFISIQDNKRPKIFHMEPQTNTQEVALAQSVRLLAQLVLRHDHDLNLWKNQDGWMLFLGSDTKGVIPILMQSTKEWKEKMGQQKVQFDHTLLPLRVVLTQKLFLEMQNRFQKVLKAGDSSELVKTLVHQEVLQLDHSWPFLRWDSQLKKMVINGSRKSITMDRMSKILDDIVEQLRTPDSVVRFHALPVQSSSKTAPWRLQVPLQSEDLINLLRQIEMNTI